MARSWRQTEGRAKGRLGACGARPPGLEWEGALLWILPTCKNEWIRRGFGSLYFRAGREVKAIREDCPPGKEEGKKVLSSISTSFPRRWKSRPAQRITLAFGALRFANKEVILDNFPFLPCRATSLRYSMPLPSLSITYPGALLSQSLRKNQYQSKPYLSKASSVIFPTPGEFTRPIP